MSVAYCDRDGKIHIAEKRPRGVSYLIAEGPADLLAEAIELTASIVRECRAGIILETWKAVPFFLVQKDEFDEAELVARYAETFARAIAAIKPERGGRIEAAEGKEP